MTKSNRFAVLSSASALLLCISAAAQAATVQNVAPDQPIRVNNISLECTGIGVNNRHRAELRDYSVRLETVGGYGQYLADETVALRSHNGENLLDVKCDAPVVMLKLDPGRYSAAVQVPGARPRDVSFAVSDHGQRNVYIRFPNKMAGRNAHMMRRNDEGNANEARKQS